MVLGGDTMTAATHIHGGTDMYDELITDLTPDQSLEASDSADDENLGDGKLNQ